MTQTSGTFPALYDGVGTKKKPKRKVVSARPGVKQQLEALRKAVKGR